MNIKQLSNELGISEQALRSWCKRNGVRKESEQETKGKKAGYFLTENDVEQIKTYYATKGKQQETKGNKNTAFDVLAAQLAEKDRQLLEKDKQIESLLEQVKQLNENLSAAHALHAGTIQALQDKQQSQAQSETTTAAAAEQVEQPTAEQAQIKELTEQVQELKAKLETAAAQEPQKKSLWSRFFKRKG